MDKQTVFPKRQIVDIETWERKDNFNFFRNFLNPCITITSEVEMYCGKRESKRTGSPSSYIIYTPSCGRQTRLRSCASE